jgi:hypothetical protein
MKHLFEPQRYDSEIRNDAGVNIGRKGGEQEVPILGGGAD